MMKILRDKEDEKRFENRFCPEECRIEKLELSDFVQLLCSDSRDYQSSSGMQTMKLPCLIDFNADFAK